MAWADYGSFWGAQQWAISLGFAVSSGSEREKAGFQLDTEVVLGLNAGVRAHGVWTYEPRQGRNAATVVCSAFAMVTLAFFLSSRFFPHELSLLPLLSCIPLRGTLEFAF